MKSLKTMPESLETMTDSVRLRPLLWKFLITGAMICLLINTSTPSHWFESVGDQLALSLNLGIFRAGQYPLHIYVNV